MPRYTGQNYSLAYALDNIGKYFWQTYRDELYCYAVDRSRTDIIEKIHREWTDEKNMSRKGTEIRIEWALAIYAHGDWEKSLSVTVPDYRRDNAKEYIIDPRRNYLAEYRCDNGIYVRSVSELCIANWLYFNHVPFEYERAVYFAGIPKPVLCDFHLPSYDIYVEFWGKPTDELYIPYMQWKIPLYAQNGYKLLSLYPNDLKNLRDQFLTKIERLKQS